MIHTIYSNLFEGLQEALFVNIKADIEAFHREGISVFAPITVIVPNPTIAERLKLKMAEKFGILAGVDFISIGDWLKPAIGLPVGMGASGDALQWAIWSVLRDPNFINELKEGPEKESAEILEEYLQGKDDVEVFELAKQVAGCFVMYASYRLDWVLTWLGCGPEESLELDRTKRDQKKLEENIHFGWQRALWKALEKREWRGIATLKAMKENIAKISDVSTNIRKKGVHIFAPFSFAPAIFPFIASVGGRDNSNNIWLYILNPSKEYWFEYIPQGLFEWDMKEDKDSVYRYLIANAASTRAMADRLYAFLNSDFRGMLFADFTNFNILEKSVKSKRSLITKNKENKPVVVPPDLKQEEQMYFLDFGNDTALHSIQSAILGLDKTVLPEAPNPQDRSLRIIKAPTEAREIENIADILHKLFEDEKLALSDVLVVVPDIEKYAPIIDAVFSSLGDDFKIPYRIAGRSRYDESLITRAISDLGDLLLGECASSELTAWMELPAVLNNFGLDVEDMEAVQAWLYSSGFRFGLSQEHLKLLHKEGDREYCLEEAIKRLSLGFVFDPEERTSFGGVLSVRGDEDTGFATVADGDGRAFFSLLRLSEQLEEARKSIFEGASPVKKTVRSWCVFAEKLIRIFFPKNLDETDTVNFIKEIQNVGSSAEEVIGETAITFDVFWFSVKQHLKASVVPFRRMDAVTFAPASMARGLPYEVIMAAGFSEESGFPGAQRLNELNLLGLNGRPNPELSRKGDRDSRSDNRNLFVDLLLAARRHFFVSYPVGTRPDIEKNASPVVTDLVDFFSLHAKETSRAAAQDLIDSVTVKLPLNRYSRGNFVFSNEKFWNNPRKKELEAYESAEQKDYSGEEAAFADCPIPLEKISAGLAKDGRLSFEIFADFMNNPLEWAEKVLGLHHYDAEAENTVSWLPDEGPLSETRRQRDFYSLLEKGSSVSELVKEVALDPRSGELNLREGLMRAKIGALEDILEEKTRFTDSLRRHEAEKASVSFSADDGLLFVRKLVCECPDLYERKEDGSLVLVATAFSNSQKNRFYLKRLLLQAALGRDVELTLFKPGEERQDLKPLEESGEELAHSLAVLLRLFEQMVLTFTAHRHKAQTRWGSEDEDDRSILASGKRSVEEELNGLSDGFKAALEKVLGLEVKKRKLDSLPEAAEKILELAPEALPNNQK